MLKSLKIQKFRMLQDFSVPHLGRVNLIVGKNNSGKSSVLEALRILARRAHPWLLDEILTGHDENLRLTTRTQDPSLAGSEASYQHFFPGREFPRSDGAEIFIGEDTGGEFVRIEHVLFYEETEEVKEGEAIVRRVRRRTVSKADADTVTHPIYQAINITTSGGGGTILYPIWERERERRMRLPASGSTEIPVSHIPTQFLPDDSLAELWDRIALTENEEHVLAALKIMEPQVEGIAFVRRDTPLSRQPERTAIVRLGADQRPVALNSMGDGMLRVLQLVLAMFPAQGGLFLIDELENGLHFGVQHKIWGLIFSIANRLNIQVFAATHSWDCIESFQRVAAAVPESGALIRVGRSVRSSDSGRVIATVFDEDALGSLTQADVEVR